MRVGRQLLFTRRTEAAAQFRARLLASPADAGVDKLQQAAAESARGLPKRVGKHGLASRIQGMMFDILLATARPKTLDGCKTSFLSKELGFEQLTN
jgi:hypothetical protein